MGVIFALSSLLVMPFWLLMICLPRWGLTARVVRSPLVAVPAATLYAALILPRAVAVVPAVARPELLQLAALLGSPDGATIAWAHFLAFDLFVGHWIYLDGREQGITAWLISPLLVLTLLLGPLGLLAYLVVRALPRRTLAAVASRALATNRPLALLGLGMLATLAAALVGLVADPRVISGAPAWLKPAKFAISIAIYSFTLLWLLTFIEGRRWLVRLASVAIAAALFVEMAIIVLQVARGTTSHFNVGTSLDTTLWQTMGAMIVVVWLMTLLVAGLLLRQRLPDPAFAWGLRLGLLISLLGMAVAFPMTQPTAAQIAEARASGQRLTVSGAHTIGAPDGGPGLPVVGWSTEAGDLRAAHFVGLHGLQVMPLAAWLVGRRRRLGVGRRVALIWTAAGLYGGLVLVLAWQALRGQPLVAPEAATLAALAGLLGAAAITAGAILGHGRGMGLLRSVQPGSEPEGRAGERSFTRPERTSG